MRYVQAAACKGLSTRASSESPSCSALLFDDIAPVHATQHQAVQVDVEVGAEPFRHKLGWISVTAPLSASSDLRPACPSKWPVITRCITCSFGLRAEGRHVLLRQSVQRGLFGAVAPTCIPRSMS